MDPVQKMIFGMWLRRLLKLAEEDVEALKAELVTAIDQLETV